MIDDRTPILVGAAHFTQKCAPEESMSPVAMIEKAARAALDDARPAGDLMHAIDTVLVVGFTVDAPDFSMRNLAKPVNPPRALAKALGIAPRREIYTYMGGNTPQMAINRLAEEIAAGETDTALLAGAEFLNAFIKLARSGADMSSWWDGEDEPPGIVWGDSRDGCSNIEAAHGMNFPANTYPMFETAIRHHRGRSVAEHMQALGLLFSPFSKVASENPKAWFPTYRAPEEIATVSPQNRMVGFPYTKYMNAIIQVDQMAAVVMTNVAKARALGIPQDRWVFLHGCADATDTYFVSERVNFHSSPAIGGMGRTAFDMAGWSVDDLDYIDLYSCFPSAVEIACAELGLAEDDPRGLTVTGGLPYFGGPGNNYAMHAIVMLMDRLRARPGTKGLSTANGWYITKHALGLYSTTPVEGPWRREAPSVLQSRIDSAEHPVVAENPSGRGRLETYTVIHGREGIRMAIVMGRLDDDRRFIAHTPHDPALYEDLMTQDCVGRTGTIVSAAESTTSVFTPD